MASSVTRYTIYTTEDEGRTLNLLTEQEGYTRKEALQKVLAQDENAELAKRIKSPDETERPEFVIAPTSTFIIVRPKVETRVEVSF